jgi:hypothetical protein
MEKYLTYFVKNYYYYYYYLNRNINDDNIISKMNKVSQSKQKQININDNEKISSKISQRICLVDLKNIYH